MDKLSAISTFITVAEEGGFAAAARRLSLSPPSVTRAVQLLEDDLGARLLHRTTRSVDLTDAGRRYLNDCRRLLADLEEADRVAAGAHGAPRGEVSVTASALFGRLHVAPALFAMLDEYPEMSVSTLFVDRVTHLVDEGIDIAVRIADLPDSSLIAARVGEVRRVVCASPAYLADRGRPVRPADLNDHDLIQFATRSPTAEWAFERDGKTTVIKPAARLSTNTADVAIAAAVAGRGVCRVLSYMVAEQVRAGTLEILLEDYETRPAPVHVVHKETGRVSARVRATVDHLVAALRQNPALRR